MIVVLAHHHDDEAADLVDGWQSHGAVLLTPYDLSVEGWVVTHPSTGGSFVAGGRRYDSASIRGVLVRLAVIDPGAPARVDYPDRAYAAAEMTALLVHWLESLTVAVVNRPSPTFLLGPRWSTEEWLTRAQRVGLRTMALERDDTAGLARPTALSWATVVGRRVLGAVVGGAFDEQLLALADLARMRFLSAGFDCCDGEPRLSEVEPCPPVTQLEVRRALEDLLIGLG